MRYRWLIVLTAAGICAGAVLGIGALSRQEGTPTAAVLSSSSSPSVEENCPTGHVRPEPLPFGEVHLEKAFAYDPVSGRKGSIAYSIKEAGLVSIRVKKAGTRELFLATIVDWEYREAGDHTEKQRSAVAIPASR